MMHRALVLVTLGLSLSACATNAIRLDRAATMSEAGREATDATMKFADRAIAANRDAMIEIVAFDPSCTIPEPLLGQGPPPKGGPPLCFESSGRQPFRYAGRTRTDLATTSAVVEGITSYLDAVDAVLAKEDIDLVGSFEEAQSDLEALRTIFGAGTAPLLTSDQSTAISSVLALLQEIASEAAKVDDLRALEARLAREDTPVSFAASACARLKEPPPSAGMLTSFSNAICGLKLANREWGNTYLDGLEDQKAITSTVFRASPSPDHDKRRAAVRAQVELYEAAAAAPKLRIAVDRLADEFAAAHRDYLELLPSGSQAALTDEEKAKRARIVRERVRAALRSFASLVAAF